MRIRINLNTHLTPPAPYALYGKLGRVVVDTDAYPASIVCNIVHAIGSHLAQFMINEVVYTNFLGFAFGLPFLASVLEVTDLFLLLGIDRNDRIAC